MGVHVRGIAFSRLLSPNLFIQHGKIAGSYPEDFLHGCQPHGGLSPAVATKRDHAISRSLLRKFRSGGTPLDEILHGRCHEADLHDGEASRIAALAALLAP